MVERVKLNPTRVKQQITEEGMTRVDLAAYYDLSVANINLFLKMTKLEGLRPKTIPFEIDWGEIDPTNEITIKESIEEETTASSPKEVTNY